MSMKDFKEESRKDWGATTDKVNNEQITLGCILRIADAVEVMATDRVKLEKDLAWYKDQFNRQSNQLEAFRKKVRGMESARSRYKNQIEQLKQKLNTQTL